MRRDDALIDDICDTGTAAVSYVENMTEEMFHADRRTQKAVISEILVMGEAVKRLSSQFRENHSQVPWSKIAGMRDKLAHDYNRIDLNV